MIYIILWVVFWYLILVIGIFTLKDMLTNALSKIEEIKDKLDEVFPERDDW